MRSTLAHFRSRGFPRPTASHSAGNANLLCSQLHGNFWQNIHLWQPTMPKFSLSRHSNVHNVTIFIIISQQLSCQSKHLVNWGKGTYPMDCTGQVRRGCAHLSACKVTWHLQLKRPECKFWINERRGRRTFVTVALIPLYKAQREYAVKSFDAFG